MSFRELKCRNVHIYLLLNCVMLKNKHILILDQSLRLCDVIISWCLFNAKTFQQNKNAPSSLCRLQWNQGRCHNILGPKYEVDDGLLLSTLNVHSGENKQWFMVAGMGFFRGGVGGCSRLELINLISAGLMAGLIFFPPLVLFHLVKQSPYRALSACGESAYLHEPAEWSPLPQEWSPDKDDPQGHWLQACLPLDSGNPALAAATAINNRPATPTDISLSLALPSTEQWTNKDRPNGVFLTVPGQKAGLPRIKAW